MFSSPDVEAQMSEHGSPPDPYEGSHDAGTNMRRPPRIFLILLAMIIVGGAALLAVLLLVGDDTEMEQQPESVAVLVHAA